MRVSPTATMFTIMDEVQEEMMQQKAEIERVLSMTGPLLIPKKDLGPLMLPLKASGPAGRNVNMSI